MQVGVKTDKGFNREKNEDFYYISDDHRFFIIADGVGGCNAGDIASKRAVESAVEYLNYHSKNIIENDKNIQHYLSTCIKRVNNIILELAHSNQEFDGMGTTIIILYIISDKVFLAHLGDSRAYLIRKKEMLQITEDHTIPAELFRRGNISYDEVVNHPQRHVITKALGMNEDIEPDLYQFTLEDQDVIILCTDGLYDEVDKSEIIHMFSEIEDLQVCCENIVKLVNSRESRDNITILALKWRR